MRVDEATDARLRTTPLGEAELQRLGRNLRALSGRRRDRAKRTDTAHESGRDCGPQPADGEAACRGAARIAGRQQRQNQVLQVNEDGNKCVHEGSFPMVCEDRTVCLDTLIIS